MWLDITQNTDLRVWSKNIWSHLDYKWLSSHLRYYEIANHTHLGEISDNSCLQEVFTSWKSLYFLKIFTLTFTIHLIGQSQKGIFNPHST